MNKITLDKFFDEYRPQINHIVRAKTNSDISDEDIVSWSGCMYETYGEELDYIISLINQGKSKHIWTIIEDDDELVIHSGFWLVNRMGYIVTDTAWLTENILVED
jgi:hypothetical protein